LEYAASSFVLQACAMCLGGASGELALAANYAIGLLLVVLFGMLGCFGAFIFYLRKRSLKTLAEDCVETGKT
jgi:hypothetical protein